MQNDDFKALSDRDLGSLLERFGIPERYMPLVQHLRGADISAQAALKSALRDHHKDYLAEHKAKESTKLKLMNDPELDRAANEAWMHVGDAVEMRAKQRRPKPTSFEVHLEIEVSRDAFIVALHKTGDIETAAPSGIAMGLPLDLEMTCSAPTL